MTTKNPKAPAKKKGTKKAPTNESAPASKAPEPESKPDSEQPDPHAQVAAAMFKEIRTWQDCKGQKVRVWHPALGSNFRVAKVLNVDLTAGSVLVLVRDKDKGGKPATFKFLLPLDSTVAQVK